MTSITKHNYGRENKENQSNNKRNGLNPPNTGESGFDWAEREAISNQRKQRITEVVQIDLFLRFFVKISIFSFKIHIFLVHEHEGSSAIKGHCVANKRQCARRE